MTQIEQIAAFAKTIHAENTDGHGFDHIETVVALAKKILATEPTADYDLVLATCYLHDTYDEKICEDVAAQKNKVAKFLSSIHYDENKAKQIFYIVDNMSFSANLFEKKALDINGQIVQDADRLEAMGTAMIIRALQYGWAHNLTLYDPAIKPQTYNSKEEYHKSQKSTTINHFYEKAFLLKNLLNTAKAREMGEARDIIMRDFVAHFEREYDESYGFDTF